MCRIFYCNKPNLLPIGLLRRTFKNLEKDAGGHGIGVGYYVNGVPVIHKGKNVSINQAAKLVSGLNVPVLVHFRAASSGTKVQDFTCHPFATREGIFCQNGGVPEFAKTGAASDTIVLRQMINHMGWDKVRANVHSYGIMCLLRPDGTFTFSRGHCKRDGCARPFKMITWSKWTHKKTYSQMEVYEEDGKPVVLEDFYEDEEITIGISNPDCMRQSWKKPEGKNDFWSIMRGVNDDEDEEPKMAVVMSPKEWKKIYKSKAPWEGGDAIFSVDIDTVAKYGLTPVIPRSRQKEEGAA